MLLTWNCIFFDDLSNRDLYQLLQLRSEVFVVEQQCMYQDMDNKDVLSWHLMGLNEHGILVAYARLLPPGISYTEPSIGRFLTSPAKRRTGVGKELMRIALDKCDELFGSKTIRIGAQVYLKKFYESFGFEVSGSVYLEDDIEHIEMVKIGNL